MKEREKECSMTYVHEYATIVCMWSDCESSSQCESKVIHWNIRYTRMVDKRQCKATNDDPENTKNIRNWEKKKRIEK